MTELKFEILVEEILNRVKELLIVKGKEYRRNNNPLHNFEKGSNISGEHPAKILDGFLLKHYISYRDLLNDIMDGKPINKDLVKEKFGDIFTYLCLQQAIFVDYIDNYKDSKETKDNKEDPELVSINTL